MYDDILLPTDGSAGMERVIDHVSSLASAHDARVHALYVINTASLSNLPMETSMEAVSQGLREEGETALDAVDRLAPEDLAIETASREGSPAREIVGYATDHNCDLVVMGTHGRSGVDRLLLGSVAERVVRRSPVPVMTVRVSADAEATASPTP